MTEKQFQKEIESLIQAAITARSDGSLSLAEAGELALSVMRLSVILATNLAVIGAIKKQHVMSGLGLLFDVLYPLIPMPMVLQPFRWMMGGAVKLVVMGLASGAVEAVYRSIRISTCRMLPDERDLELRTEVEVYKSRILTDGR